MVYTAYYKKITEIFWKKLKNVKGDGILQESNSRFFILSDETRIEICTQGMMFKFDSNRFMSIKKNMELQAGMPIPTRD